MFEKKDYSKFTVEDLKLELVKLKKTGKVILVIAAFATGITLYAVYSHNINFIHVVLPLGAAIYLGHNGEQVKVVEKEISSRKS